jgi:protein gp37
MAVADATGIEWCDATINLWVGCTQLSPACDHCYAMNWGPRLGVAWNGPPKRLKESSWGKIEAYQRGAERFYKQHGRRRRVFINSLSDFFDNKADPVWQVDACNRMEAAPDVIFILVTKRPQNVLKRVPVKWLKGGWPKNIWLLTTVENQEEANRRIPVVLNLKVRAEISVVGVSMEPLLSDVDLTAVRGLHWTVNALDPMANWIANDGSGCQPDYEAMVGLDRHRLDWIIIGGESGHKARRMGNAIPLIEFVQAMTGAAPSLFVKQLSQRDHPSTFKDFASFPPAMQIREFPVG